MSSHALGKLCRTILMLLAMSVVIFALIDLAPGSPLSQLPLSVPPEVQQALLQALGADQPILTRYLLWLRQFFWVEPLVLIDHFTGSSFAQNETRIISWQSRSPVMAIIAERLPQTLLVVGAGYVLGMAMAVGLTSLSLRYHHRMFGRAIAALSACGYFIPTYVMGLLLIILFAFQLRWVPTIYDTTLWVDTWGALGRQLQQMALPVLVLALYNCAEISRYLRGAMLTELGQDYVRAARARGIGPMRVLLRHVLRNAAAPLINIIAMGLPTVFAGAIVTEHLFRINGLGSLLIGAVQSGDLPMAQTLLVIYAALILLCTLLADLLQRTIDPRIADA